jgi:energy-coupling factor transporter ATP-binding protein EcfA2
MLSVYQNSNVDNYEKIKAGFIVRTAEYETIISSLKNKKPGDSIQHELILGRRGSGKSTLLKRIEMEISENEELNTKYIPVNPAEEQAGIYRLMDLWEQVLQELYCRSEEKQEVKSFSEFEDEQAYTRYLYSEIHRVCKNKKKKAVLLLDNFDRIVGSFSDDGNLLRETLINYHDLVFIAASTRMDEHFWQYDQPFYEFFRRHRLETLSSKETFTLLAYWSDSPDFEDAEREKIKNFLQKFPGKVDTIRLLTDGLPRTMLFFLKIVMQSDKPVETDFLKRVMDEVTPLYQERLLNQPPQMRKILLEMAFMWEAVATKEIAERCRMESKLVAAHLKTLTDRNIVETIATDKRNNLYRIAERFFNMWLIVTQGNPDQKRKARWMSEFLEIWYTHDRDEGKDMDNILIEIWAGIFNQVEERAIAVCKDNNENSFFIKRLLVHQQKSLVDKLFHHAEFGKRLQEQYTVLYYASQILNGKENENNLRLRIPPELQTTLDEILQKIKEEQDKYH